MTSDVQIRDSNVSKAIEWMTSTFKLMYCRIQACPSGIQAMSRILPLLVYRPRDTTARLRMQWERVRIHVPFSGGVLTNTRSQSLGYRW